MAKKKKTQLKPVARGFATQSVPKKIVDVQPEQEPNPSSAPLPTEEEVAGLPAASKGVSEGGTLQVASTEGTQWSDTEKAEERALQALVDKHQERIEREVVRTVKNIEQDRRFADSLPRLALDPSYVDQILDLVRDMQATEDRDIIEEPEEKAITRLAITYGVLRRLGFSENTAEECLRSINGIGLEEAYQWVSTLVCAVKNFVSQQSSYCYIFRNWAYLVDKFMVQLHPDGIRSPSVLTAGSSTLNLNNSPFVRSPTSSSAPSRDETVVATSRLPETPVKNGLAYSEYDTSDDPNEQYVRLKMQIADLTTHRKSNETRDAIFLRNLQRRLEQVEQDYLLDRSEAEASYQVEREKANAVALHARLRQEAPSPESERKTEAHATSPRQSPANARTPESQATPQNVSEGNDIFDEESDASGGLFELLEELPTTETTQEGTLVQIRDMALPKHWSGRTPRILLMDAVRKLDKYAGIEIHTISGSSRAKRAALRIRWGQGRINEWPMEDVACHDVAQAEQYVSLIALHALTFPPTEGFAVGVTSTSTNQTFFRLLPPAFRELWDELEQKRRAQHDSTNRAVWAKLKAILAPKLAQQKSAEKQEKHPNGVPDRSTLPRTHQSGISSEQLIADFEARQSRPEYQAMQRQRDTLPIAAYRRHILDALETSQVLVLSGETGCGKSTQVPSFILEDHLSQGRHCKIYCTEPRRISAISLASRVSQELGEPAGVVGTPGSLVGYSIRLENFTSKTTRLTFVTNGIALRMLEAGSGQGGQGSAFDEITHIIIDEVHERTIESDFLLIVLKSLVKQRPDIKVVLMSATLDAEKFSKYFDDCPVLQIPGRTFPVEVRYLEDAIEFTKWKVTEDSPYAIHGNDKYSRGKAKSEWSEDTAPADDDDDDVIHENVLLEKRYSPTTASSINVLDERLVPYELIVRLLEHLCLQNTLYHKFSSAILVFMPGMGEIRRLHELLMDHPEFASEDRFRIYPLHSTISSDQQAAAFDIPPPGIRKIVIATNIAETGITIPDITCVIDTGRQREMRFDEKRQLSRLVETFVARSNAKQRRGRAGRVQPGLCFHLFTKVRHDTKMAEHPDPEMLRLSLSDLALRIKILKVNLGSSIEDVLSQALDPPSPTNVSRAIAALVEVRALTTTQEITPMGRLLSKMPTDVHLGKFLLIASLFRCLDPALTIVAALSSKSPFLTPFGKEDEAHRQKMAFKTENSDFLTLHNAFASWRTACANGPSAARKLCRTAYLSHQNLQQIEELRQQLFGYLVDSNFVHVDKSVVREINRPRYGRGKTRFVAVPPEWDRNSGNPSLIHAALCAGLYPKILSVERGKNSRDKLLTITNNQPVSFHPSSINFMRRPDNFGVNYLCYFTIMQSKKMYAWETGPVDDLALLLLCGDPDFKLTSNSVLVDRKIRYRLEPKTNVALKYLRNQLGLLLAAQFRGESLANSQVPWHDIAITILSKVKPPQEPESKSHTLTLVLNRHI
ncbi:hypothetical protein NM688_g1149 [Phlebia brevispora]|uniref:Uncharacterized protein n=1 Tax=Phlebia brevispora TaxID=194682 RepID=A0ACC1TCM2_9APHY|nr:hypothetical protein NM688_g1149 [Phlebia brevispora]